MSHISGAMLLSPTPIVRKRWRLSDRLYFHTFSDDPLWLVGFYILILMLWSDVRVLFSVIHSPFLDSQKKRKSIVTVLLSKDPSRKEKKVSSFFYILRSPSQPQQSPSLPLPTTKDETISAGLDRSAGRPRFKSKRECSQHSAIRWEHP